MPFMVLGYDGDDDQAPARRASARDAHLERAARLYEQGTLRFAAAILDEDGRMIGSTMFVEVSTREALDQWLAEEPYVSGDVWRTIRVRPCSIPPLFDA
jgi:uncharacterized protein YciI